MGFEDYWRENEKKLPQPPAGAGRFVYVWLNGIVKHEARAAWDAATAEAGIAPARLLEQHDHYEFANCVHLSRRRGKQWIIYVDGYYLDGYDHAGSPTRHFASAVEAIAFMKSPEGKAAIERATSGVRPRQPDAAGRAERSE